MGTPRHNAFASGLLAGSAGGSNLFAGGASGGGGMLSGTPNNFGKMGDAGTHPWFGPPFNASDHLVSRSR